MQLGVHDALQVKWTWNDDPAFSEPILYKYYCINSKVQDSLCSPVFRFITFSQINSFQLHKGTWNHHQITLFLGSIDPTILDFTTVHLEYVTWMTARVQKLYKISEVKNDG